MPLSIENILTECEPRLSGAVKHFWRTRAKQASSQRKRGQSDQGSRGAVTGGGHMDGFVDLVVEALEMVGVPRSSIQSHANLELPGFFRPTKEWDMLVTVGGQLVLAVEVKSQVGPSFGNNFNNRTEEAMGSALDIWTAFREGAFQATRTAPWLGYLFHLEDCDRSNVPVKVKEPHFPVFKEFRGASYAKRYEEFCRRMVRERHYNSAMLVTSRKGSNGPFVTPPDDLAWQPFFRSMLAHASTFVH